ncbi:N-acetyl-gamma-glutamyl-phosphate reductase [Brevibacterium sp. XM4083]|uniref:N-acetyl-gamma-glutamyl-phosphate reductase n=1 Tax=Brevibacterium sp. XM4083 TaxID=2583238 RepID=UPI00112C7503|nr:N-acetyl-gamma-glutamyl-phosphate reductase [Brevibacterium sp. XM4083]MCM1011813.1 N-acetyl-gamma-glutamyl-phosphate reductase [Brevibacterium sp. XM4083]
MIRAGIVGASGLAGGELVRLLTQHPSFEITIVCGSGSVGKLIHQLHPNLRDATKLTVQPIDPHDIEQKCDVVFLATPPAESSRIAELLAETTTRVIDLSGAFRIKDATTHSRWYPSVHRNEHLATRFLYGVPELVADAEWTSAQLISLPGCFATAIALSLAPLVDSGIPLGRVIVDGKTGSSGGGVSGRSGASHPIRTGSVTPYAPAGHRHSAEVEEFLNDREPTSNASISMSAYGVSHVRGLLATSYLFPQTDLEEKAARKLFFGHYRGKHFVRVRSHTESTIPLPDPHALVASNYCDITVARDPNGGPLVVMAALDNLIKGAAGQAIQVANLAFGRPEEEGIGQLPVFPA